MVNYFHVFIILFLFIIWKESLPFVKNYDVEDRIKLIAKIGLILVIMILTLATPSLDRIIGFKNENLIEANLYRFTGSVHEYDITHDNKEDLEDLVEVIKNVELKYTLKFPNDRHKGSIIRVFLYNKNDIQSFAVTEDNYIWYEGKYYKCIDVDLYSQLKESLIAQDVLELPTK